ncbi:MAG: hypothetical protein U9N59_03040 [Campylobacterota bacterium]|nr:hypothetical protein [Campylobacterota bacterium]
MILDFNNSNAWMSKIDDIFAGYNYSPIVNKFKNSNNALTIDDITSVIGNKIINSTKNYIQNTYSHVAYYHGTATNDITSYLDKGLLPLNIKERNLFARKLFNQSEYPEITDIIFNNATIEQFKDKNSLECRNEKLFLTLDDNVLKEESSHYLIYGGEHLLHLAQNLGYQYPKELPKKLTPLILKCKVSIKLLSEHINIITEEIIIRYFENIIYPEYKFEPLDTGICLTTKIKPEDIIGFEFPTEIKKCYF